MENEKVSEKVKKSMVEEFRVCPCCRKRTMQEVFDGIAEKKTGHLWHCDCMPKDMNLSIG